MTRYINADSLLDYLRPLAGYELISLKSVKQSIDSEPTADIREVMASAWIPVTERLPEESGVYLATVQFPSVRVVTLLYYSAWYKEFRSTEGNDLCVTAWMPKPEPYRGDE